MPNEVIAFITEGDWSEPQLIKNIKKNFYFGSAEIMPFKTNIHALYQVLKDDDFETDIIDVLCERDNDIKERIGAIGKESISQIFLFFDYDGHDSQCDNENIVEMLDKFNNETENGKLYISYPMFEAFKDFTKEGDECSRRCCTDISVGRHYKEDVSNMTAYQQLSKIDDEGWDRIINFSIKKAACIVQGSYTIIDYDNFSRQIRQLYVFRNQLEKYIVPCGKVAVLSAFPLFLVEFFGESFYEARLVVKNEVKKGGCIYTNTPILL